MCFGRNVCIWSMFWDLQRRIKKCIEHRNVSEADTQSVLVEPLLNFVGFDVSNVFEVKRADRNSKKIQFDVEVWVGEKLLIGIEIKSINSSEFNICDGKVKEGIGELKLKENGEGYENKFGDGVGQLKRYVIEKEPQVAILTNGIKWGVFKNIEAFTKNPTEPLNLDFFGNSCNFKCFNVIEKKDFKELCNFLVSL